MENYPVPRNGLRGLKNVEPENTEVIPVEVGTLGTIPRKIEENLNAI